MPSPYYALQASFASGAISEEVASRVDLEKYQSALLTAENVIVKPYGGVARRPGTLFLGACKYADKQCVLVRFNNTEEVAYMLEVGYKYIRVWKNGVYLSVELTTPFEEENLINLRFNQSADTMFICSGTYPVQVLTHFSDTVWTLVPFEVTHAYYDVMTGDTTSTNTITPSALSGSGVTLTSINDVFLASQVGGYIRLSHDIESGTMSMSTNSSNSPQTTPSLLVGDSWKLLTHGTWAGNIVLQTSDDGTTWKEYRKYTGNSDFNASESGTFDTHTYIRAIQTISEGTLYLDLTRYPYTHEGTAKITGYTSAKVVTVTTVDDEPFGSTAPTTEYAFGVWSENFGYPYCSTFFQDRLVFAGSTQYPHVVWMSRTGDYYNFGIEKVDGTLTDDSALAVSVISREVFKINHLVSAKDLIVLTNGNEWIISGNTIVTPASPPNPMVQTTRGSNECEPQFIGNRTIYVQRRNGTVRDLGYTYESDNYTGDDLTQLAKDLVDGYDLTDSTFQQEPNSIIYFVRTDGAIVCLTYIREQKVFGWSSIATDGLFESVANVVSNNNDTLYAVVKRTINGSVVRYIEVFDEQRTSSVLADYVMTDCSKVVTNVTATNALTGLTHLAGKTVQVIGDGRRQPDITVATDGTATIADSCLKVTVGLKYAAKIETPNMEMTLKDGSMQGRPKKVVEAYLRLKNSLGGQIGNTFDVLDSIPYDEFLPTGAYVLYTDDKKAILPGDYNNSGRVCLYHDEPYPFSLSAIVRVVNFG